MTVPEGQIIHSQNNQIQSFEFDVITVNAQEQEVQRKQHQALYFTEDLGRDTTLDMVFIPGGKFLMGSPKEQGYKDEYPQHEVTIQPFFMGKYPVTQVQWKAVAFLPRINCNIRPNPSFFKGDNLPVESISWDEAVEFCARLSAKTQKQYRLPSEAEWEYACRAGTQTPFYFGESITKELANCQATKILPVGGFHPNAFGLYDMHGGVYEWCTDIWHHSYAAAPKDGSAWIDLGKNSNEEFRVLRGGSWLVNLERCRSANRHSCHPETTTNTYGFRIAYSVSF